jgi:glucokinase
MLFVTIGTGISACAVINGRPYLGAQGLTGTFASSPGLIPGGDGKRAAGPPLEAYSSGPAIAARYAAASGAGSLAAPDVIQRCRDGDPAAWQVVATAGEALGAAIGQLVNVLDPSAVVLGGGMGLVEGLFRESITSGFRSHVWSEFHRGVPLVSAQFGPDAGLIGAALAAAEGA